MGQCIEAGSSTPRDLRNLKNTINCSEKFGEGIRQAEALGSFWQDMEAFLPTYLS